MASKHRRHSSVDTLGWMYTNRADEPLAAAAAAAALDRSVSTRMSSFRHEVFPALKRQTSLRFNPGEYFAGCFGPRERPSDGAVSSIVTSAAAARPRRNGHSRSLSTSFLSNFGFGGKTAEELPHRALQQPAGRWILENDEEYYLKPPVWKQALRKLQAEARRHVHPAPPRERLDYDAESYQKNFDNGALPASLVVEEEEDEFEVKARVLHTRLLTKLHSKRFEKEHAGLPPAKLLKSVSVPAVPVRPASDAGVRIWERRVAHRPLTKLELTRSI